MRGLKINILMGVLVLVISFSALYLISVYHKKIESLENNVVKLQDQNKTYKQAMKFLSVSVRKQAEQRAAISGYNDWKQAEKLADHFVTRSNGKFQKDWALFLINEAERYGMDPYIVYELIRVETGNTFNPELTGPPTKYGRAYGLSQFMKNTAPWIAEMADLPYKDKLLFDPYYSIQLSVVYLNFLHDRYESWDQALTAYHRGMYGMKQYIKENGHAKSWYAKEIQHKAEELKLVSYKD